MAGRNNGPTQWFKYQTPGGDKVEYGDADPTTQPWWKVGQAAKSLANAWSRAVPRMAAMSQQIPQPWQVGGAAARAGAQYGAASRPKSEAAYRSMYSGAQDIGKQVRQGWSGQNPVADRYNPQDNQAGNPQSFGAQPQPNWYDPTSPQSFRGPAQAQVPTQYPVQGSYDNAGLPYDIAQMQQVAGMPGTNWQNPGWGGDSQDNNMGNPTSYGGNFTAANNLSDGQTIRGGNWSNPQAGASAAPAIPKGWEQFGQQWWDKFVNTERQLTPSTRGMTTPDQYYRNPEQAAADIAWSKQFRAMTGHDPTEDDWRFHYMNGGGAKDNTALQNAAMSPSGGPYGR